MPLEQAVVLGRTVLSAAGPGGDAARLRPVLVATVPWWAAAACEQVAREIVLLRSLLGADELTVLALCLARPREEPVWADFRRLTVLFENLDAELRAQRRRARVPGPGGRRAAAEAAGTRTVLARAAAEFSAAWGRSAQALDSSD